MIRSQMVSASSPPAASYIRSSLLELPRLDERVAERHILEHGPDVQVGAVLRHADAGVPYGGTGLDLVQAELLDDPGDGAVESAARSRCPIASRTCWAYICSGSRELCSSRRSATVW
jgi:hypothetical protein